MIKKLLLAIAILFVLTGCSEKNDFKSTINLALSRACNESIPDVENNNCIKTYYTYYLDKNIGKLDGDEISNQFKISGNLSALTLDISSITLNHVEEGSDVNDLRDIGTLENLVYSRTGRFYNSSNQMVNYRISITETDDSNYFIMIQTPQFIFISKVTNSTCSNTVHDMIVLLRSCTVDDEQIVYDYASDSIVSTPTNVITLFNEVIPESGYIIDYIDDWKDDKTFITIEKIEEPEEEHPDYSETIDDGETEPSDNDRQDGGND